MIATQNKFPPKRKHLLTNSTEVVHNKDQSDDWLVRAGLLMKSNLDDCLQRAGFHGAISITLLVKNSSVIGVDSNIKQTIRQ